MEITIDMNKVEQVRRDSEYVEKILLGETEEETE